jgi:hypothetical protein
MYEYVVVHSRFGHVHWPIRRQTSSETIYADWRELIDPSPRNYRSENASALLGNSFETCTSVHVDR